MTCKFTSSLNPIGHSTELQGNCWVWGLVRPQSPESWQSTSHSIPVDNCSFQSTAKLDLPRMSRHLLEIRRPFAFSPSVGSAQTSHCHVLPRGSFTFSRTEALNWTLSCLAAKWILQLRQPPLLPSKPPQPPSHTEAPSSCKHRTFSSSVHHGPRA